MVDPETVQPEHAVIAEQLAGWREKYPDVQVDHYVFRGPPALCLLGYAGHASPERRPQMVVVGGRGRGPLTGLLIGPTGSRPDRPRRLPGRRRATCRVLEMTGNDRPARLEPFAGSRNDP